ncbi:very short patch repair endonuclease [Bilophila wadsworthia]|uniref:very short patch repair endonuclease n=1 Tax=Bilophila wadsworthia TaxID=35833 RepID=UPI0026764F2C|nr:very short patch repair endonuclease [Bilophila wadsworthia]
MTDIVSTETRHRMMAGIRSKNTKPEILVRQWLHRHGYRFRLHRKDIPGTPDVVLPRHQTLIFVHGCFWHHHEGCRYAYTPATRTEWWIAKFEKNRIRDINVMEQLKTSGWHVLVIWECEIKNGSFTSILEKFFRQIEIGNIA